MATKTIAWESGGGYITLTYTGVGNGPISVQSDTNELFEDRQQTVQIVTTDGSPQKAVNLLVKQKGKTYPAGTVFNFAYTGSVQQVTLPKGKYKLQCWGAQGGNVSGSYTATGSKGGYSEGVLTLTEPTTIYVFVGGQGTSSSSSSTSGTANGGWNGGGASVRKSSYSSGNTYGESYPRPGGGATDMCLVTSSMAYSSGRTNRSSASLLSRFIVAGGGAGASARYTEETEESTSESQVSSGALSKDSSSTITISDEEYNTTGTSLLPAIGTTLKAGVTYTVQLDYNIVTGSFVYLGASNINSGLPKDKLTNDLYNKKGSLTIEYTPTVDVKYWRIQFSSDYVYSEDSYVSIAYSEKTDSKEIIQNLQSEVLELNDVVETLGTLTILDEDYIPTKEAYRPAIGTTLKAGVTYTVQLDYNIVTGNFAYLGANNSEGGMPADNLTGNLYNQKGSRTIEYTPSVDVTYWYIQMASNFVYSEKSVVSISVQEKVEVAETVKNLQANVDTLKSKVTSIIATDFELTASASNVLTSNYARNDVVVSLNIQANSLFEKIRIKYGSSAYVDISDNNVEIGNGNSEQHNLNLSSKNKIGIFLDKRDGRTIVVRISSDGVIYETKELTFSSQGGVTVQNLGSNTLNFTSFAYCPKMINYELWFIGDSYLSTGDPARWPQQLASFGYSKYYIDQLSGGSSPTMYNSLMADLKIKKPKYLVWCLGMNDTDGTIVSSSWLTAIQNVMKLADEGINVILCTIPSVPTRSNALKNEFVKSSGFRYIDFAAAVEKGDGSQNWHDGLLSSDGVHPTEAGAKILAAQVLLDFPELCTITR